MRNLVPLGARRWRLKMAPDPDAGEPGALETIVGCCYDPQSRVVYAVTSACNLYGVHIGGDSGGGDASRPFLRMSLLVGGGGDGALADEEPALPARSVAVGVEYIAELRGVCIAVASGELILVAPDPDDDHATTTARGGAKVGEAGVQIPAGAVGPECIPECVGAVSSGIRAMRWNPDGEILLLASGDGQLVCMNKDFFVLAEAPLCRTTATASLSWRGDGAYAASLTLEDGDETPRLRVWSREDLEPHSDGEVSPSSPLESGGGGKDVATGLDSSSSPPLAWQPRGALVAAASAGGGVVFFERNGLRRGGFDLPRDGAGDRVRALAWSSDSSALCVTVSGDSAHGVQVWTRGNMHWYLKREMRYPRVEVSDGSPSRAPLVRWDEDDADVLRVFTADGTVEEHLFGWDACVSRAATAAVVDGCRALITPLARTPLPPPMCAATAVFSAPVSELAWLPPVEGEDEAGETLLALLADGTLEIVSSTRGTEWEETCEELADAASAAKGDDGDDAIALKARSVRIVEDETVAAVDASFSGAANCRDQARRLRHLECPAPSVAVMTADVPKDGSAAFLVLNLRRDEVCVGADRDDGWSGSMTRACFLPGEATRVTSLEGGTTATAFVQVRGQSTPTVWTGGEGDAGGCSPTHLPDLALGEPCAVARAFATADGRSLLVGLDAGGTLRCGSRAVATGVRSFAVHRCAGDGTVAAGSDAPDVSYAVSLSRDSVPRVAYVTLADELRVAEVADLTETADLTEIANLTGAGDSSGRAAGPAEAEAPQGRNELASAAGGKRRGGNSRSAERGGVYMDQLHVSMRAAMRPADWARAADSRTRRVEEGSRIVAAPPGSVNVVLQMPRGNLETVAPRSLALPAVTAALAAGRFAAASTLAARHRVDLNLLVDYAWPSFLSRANEFVESVDDPDVVMELIEVLDSADTTAPGGVYAHLRRPDADTSNGSSTDKSGARDETVEKVAGTCSAIRAAVEARSCAAAAVGSDGAVGVHLLDDRWELVVLSAHARTEPPDLGAALRRVGRRRELELAAVAGGGGTSGTALDSATALKHLLALVGGEALYDAALGTYDLSLAYLVGTHSAMDPGEFVADLKRLQDIESEPLRRADVDARLGRWPSCVENLLRGGNIAGACEVAERRRLFPHALAALSDVVAAEDPAAPKEPAVEVRREVTRAYAAFLSRERRHEDAAVALLSVGESRAALDEYREAIAWRPALALAARLGLPRNERASIAEELCEGLELTDPSSAAVVAAQHLGDVDRAVGSLTRAREWRESARVAYLHDRADLVETVVAPAAAEAAQGILSEATELPARLNKYLTRLRDLRHRREAMRRAIDAGAEAWRGGALGGGDDDDAASEAPSLASGVSGMSAYTDRTTGAQTATSHARSGVPSTQGGRKPTRKQRRGKKAGAGLRAGGPTEERDLAAHLASGAVAGSIGAPTALETIGELTELLVSLGHAEDAAALQRAVSEAVAALEAAREEARRRVDALNREDAAEGNGDAHEVSAGASAASKEVQTTTAQWKWAALRGSNAR